MSKLDELARRGIINRKEYLVTLVFGYSDQGCELAKMMVDENISRALIEATEKDLNAQSLAFDAGRRSFVCDIIFVLDRVRELLAQELPDE